MEGRKEKSVPAVRPARQRYFDNPFPDYAGQALGSPLEYMDQALGLMQDVYSYYSQFPNCPRRDLYIGGAGVALGCFRLANELPDQNPDKKAILTLAERIMDPIMADVRQRTNLQSGTFGGDYGVLVPAALVYSAVGRKEDAETALTESVKLSSLVQKMTIQGSSADQWLMGKTGYLSAFLELWKKFPDHPCLSQASIGSIVKSIIESGGQFSNARGFHSRSPLMFFHFDAEYIGAAHGLSEIKSSLDYLLSSQKPNGNYGVIFGAMDDDKNDELVQWCHGAPGVIYVLAKAYVIWKEEKYLNACKRCADIIWKKGLLKKGPGLCHGISGNAYAFLIMYRLSGNAGYLFRANCFADIMFQQSVRELSRLPDNPYSLFEGIAGTMCFYADVTDPLNSSFSFFDIFADCLVKPIC